jgi:GntR family transcriptional regulator
LFHLNETSGIPVYLQLREQILHAISRGDLRPGDQLPTVREVAIDLSINPNTVNRAYAELERDGVLKSTRGRGTFIAEPASATGVVKRRDRLVDIAKRAIAEAVSFGFTAEELVSAIKRASADRV